MKMPNSAISFTRLLPLSARLIVFEWPQRKITAATAPTKHCSASPLSKKHRMPVKKILRIQSISS